MPAHSSHVRGTGTFENGIEKLWIDVVLDTSIRRKKCEEINLGYMEPTEINPSDYMNRAEDGILFVDHPGEKHHRLIGLLQPDN